ncbi:MAG: hypothetical protein WBB82_03715 [Limnothrix sp.]
MLLSRRLQHYVLGSLVALGSIACGIAPQLEAKPTLFSWQHQAIAQQFTPGQIDQYAEAYLLIYGDSGMTSLLAEVETLIGKKPSWELRCDQSSSINRLNNREAIRKVRDYCNKTLPSLIDDIIPRSTFNRITNQLNRNPTLQNDVEEAMRDILNRRQGN